MGGIMNAFSVDTLKERIKKYPKKKLIHIPTPLQRLDHLSEVLGGPEIFIKRDDLTGHAFGGNKSRKLEFIIQDVLEKNADVIVTWASLQSNWCLQTAAAARKIDVTPVLVLFKTYDLPEEYDGNLLLDFILKADIRIMDTEKGKVLKQEDVADIIDKIVLELKEKGHSPYVAPIGGSMVGGSMDKPLGAIAYVNAAAEIVEQVENEGIRVDHIIHASGSGGTQAGLVVGTKALGRDIKVSGISVSDERESYSKEILTIARDTVEALHLELTVEDEDIIVMDEYIKEGYGVINREVSEAIRFMALKEGIFLDPVYTGKAMVALIDLVKKGCFTKDERIVFVHTGGTPALFPNKYKITEFLSQ